MPKQLNVNLAFTADTSKASKEIQSLQQQLTQLMNTAVQNSNTLGLTKDIREASTAVAQLKAQLSSAMTTSGTLDLSKFNDSLRASGMTLEEYRIKLSSLGPEGTQAFSALASQISSAEIPLRRANTLLSEMGTTLMNTARWQLSSSLLHGFIGGLQHAYGYAQDLNQSLNNIRIVTGQSTEQMAQLAQKANQAAKELSTRTTDYTNASLIYYQQGLDDKAVEARTRTTLKLANVTRQSAEEVSNQMTAIWNNFDDGTKSLEYYADAITALGAKTASSSSEIAEGLSKFASVADTIGLSYETATSALATVVAETRQSADTVGTAFKTLFSRIQSIKLGETLEDGVGLTKYTEAIEKAGVNVLDMNGKLREADDILTDLGHRWEEIDNTQRAAIAQTVAGQRQYSQFMALMENWDKVEQNIQIAEGSEGTLQEQADIYAESWEAASKRVQASAEAIYDALVSDKFFIGFNDLIAGVLDRVNDLIKGLGGLPGVLTTVGALLTRVFSTQLAGQIERIAYNIKMSTAQGRASVQALQQQANLSLQKNAQESALKGTNIGEAQSLAYKNQADLQQTLIKNSQQYNQEQVKTAQYLLDQNKALGDNVIKQGQLADEAQRETERLNRSVLSKARNDTVGVEESTIQKLQQALNTAQEMSPAFEKLQVNLTNFESTLNDTSLTAEQKVSQIQQAFQANEASIKKFCEQAGVDFEKLKTEVGQLNASNLDQFRQTLQQLSTQGSDHLEQIYLVIERLIRAIFGDTPEATKMINDLRESFGKLGAAGGELETGLQSARNSAQGTKEALDGMAKSSINGAQAFASFAGVMMSLASVINSVKAAWDIWNNDELSVPEKLLQTIPSLVMSFSMLTTAMTGARGAQALYAAGQIPLVGSILSATAAKTGDTVATNILKGSMDEATISAYSLGTALKVAFPLLLGITAAIGAVAVAAKVWDETHYSFEEKMEDAKEATEYAAEAADKAKEKYEAIASAVDEYDAVIKTLESCTTGTDEWREALEKVQEVTSSMIDQYPELVKFYNSTTGTFDMEQVQNYLDLLEKQKLTSDFQNYYQPTVEKRISAEESSARWEGKKKSALDSISYPDSTVRLDSVNLQDIVREITDNPNIMLGSEKDTIHDLELTVDSYKAFLEGVFDEAEQLDKTSETFKEDLFNAIKNSNNKDIQSVLTMFKDNAEINAQAASLSEEQLGLVYDEVLNQGLNFLDQYITLMCDAADDVDEYEGNLHDAVDRIINARLLTLKDQETISDSTKLFLRQYLEDIIKEQSEYQELAEDFNPGKMDLSGRGTSLRSQDTYYTSKNANLDTATGDERKWMKEFTSAYIGAVGQDLKFTGKTYGDDADRKYEFSDGENTITVAAEQMASTITLFENGVENFDDLLNDAGLKAEEVFGKNLPQTFRDAVASGIANPEQGINFSHVSNSGMRGLLDQYGTLDRINQANAYRFDILKGFGLNEDMSNFEEAKKNLEDNLHITYEELFDLILNGFEEYDKGLLELRNDTFKYSDTAQAELNKILDSIWTESLSFQTKVKDQYVKAYLTEGKEDDKALASFYKRTGYNSEELFQGFEDGTITDLESLNKAEKELGIETLTTASDFEILKNILFDTGTEAENTLESFSSNLADITKITSQLDKGDTISAEDYEKLGSEITDGFFAPMADGTYVLTAKADEFKDHINSITFNDLKEKALELKDTASNRLTSKYNSFDELKNAQPEAGAAFMNTIDLSDEADQGQLKNHLRQQENLILKDQIDYLNEIGVLEKKDAEDLRDGLQNYDKRAEAVKKINELMEAQDSDGWNIISDNAEKDAEELEKIRMMIMSTATSGKELQSYFKEGIFGDPNDAQLWQEVLSTWFNDYFNPSNISTLQEYKDALKGIGDEAQMTGEQAKEVWKNIDPSTLKMSDLSFIKSEFKAGRMEVEEYQKAISSLTNEASSLSELHKLLDDATPEDYSAALQRILNSSGSSTKEALEEIDKAILNGKADAELLGTVLDKIMGASDLNTTEKAQELENRSQDKIVENPDRPGHSKTIKAEISDKDAGLGMIELAQNANDLFDNQKLDLFNQGLEKIGDTSELTAVEVGKIGAAATSIYKDSDFFTLDEQIKGITDAFKVGGEENFQANLKGYSDAIKDIILNSKELDLDEKLDKIREKLSDVPPEELSREIKEIIANDSDLTTEEKIDKIREELGDSYVAEHFKEIIDAILNNDSSTTTAEKLKNLLDLLGQGIGKAKDFKNALGEYLEDKDEDAQTKLNFLNNNEDEIKKQSMSDAKKEARNIGLRGPDIDDYAEETASTEMIDNYQKVVDSLTSSSFETPEAFIEFFDMLPEGVNQMSQLTNLFGSIADKVTSFDQLDKLGDLMSQNGAKDSDFTNPENEGWQTAMDSARTSEAEDIGVDVDVFKNYEDAIYETIKAENDLLQSQGEVGRSEEALQVLSMKMTKSMMEQEKGFENLGSTLKKYGGELDNLDETSVDSTEALTNIQKACNQLFGGKVSKNFVKENLEDIKKAANNDQDALKRLQKEAAKDYASGLKEAKKAAASTAEETKNTVKAFDKLGSSMEDAFKDMENAEIGDDISDSFRQTLNDMLASGEMTTDEIAQLLSNMGYDTNFDSVTMGFDEATEIMKNKTDILGDYMSQGMDAALANLSDSAAAQLQNLVSQYEQAGYSEAEAMNAALNSVGTQLEVSEEQITADENAAATSQSTFEMKGTLTMPNGETSDFGANATVTTNTDGGGDADISIPVLGKGGAAFNGGGAGAGARTGGGGGGGGGGCFVAGTVVSIQSGFKNIEDIQIGDVVLSYNEQKKENEYSEVLQKFVHLIKDNIYTLYIENDKLEVTGIHRFLITRNEISEWIHASDLQVGDLMQFADGTLHEIFQIDKEIKLKTVYNFEVSNNHNYYVGKNQVLAHNKGCFEAGTQITMRDYYKNIEDVKPGDIVLSYNEKTNKNEYSEVLQTMIHLVKEEIYSLYIEDDVLFATGIHRFLITRNGIRGWVEASNLQIGDLVQFADGTLHEINDIRVEIKIKTVYNFEVSNNHNYYVGKNQILAHNKGRGSRGGRNRPTTVRKAAAEEVHTEDRYHKLDKTLERLNKQYEDINKAKDHAFGGKHIAALNREIELQKELNKTNEDYLAKIQEYKNKDLSLLTGKLGNKDSSKWSSFGDVAYQSTSVDYGTKTKKKKGKVVKDKKGNAVKTKDKKKIVETESTQYAKVGLADLGINVDTNEFGQITNIDQVNAKIDEFYNKGAKAYAKNYNANLKDDASLSEKQANAKAQNAWNRVQAITEAARKWVEQYEEDVTLEMDKISEIIDGKVKEQELRLEKAQYVVEIRAEMDENSLNVINFALDMMGDKARTATSRIAKLGESLKVLTKDYSSGTSDRISGIQELLDGIATKANEGSFTDNDNKVWKFNQADFDASKSIGQATNDKGENTLQQMMKYGKNATDAINSIAQSGIISSDQIKWMVEQSQTELENVKKVKEVREQIFEIIQSTWDEYSEKFDKILEKQEKYMNMTKGIQNVVNLVGRSNFGFQDDGEDVEADKRRTARQKGRDLEASIDENLKKQANNRIKAYRLEQAEITKILQKNEEQRNKVKKAMDDKEKAGTLTDEAKEEYMQELDAYDAIIESMCRRCFPRKYG